MENMDMQKWVLIVWPEITQMPQSLSSQFICQSPKVLDFNEKNASFVWVPICTAIQKNERNTNTVRAPP